MSEISITAPEDIETKIKMLVAGLHISQKSIMKDFEAAVQ